jgi:hypothetical protein
MSLTEDLLEFDYPKKDVETKDDEEETPSLFTDNSYLYVVSVDNLPRFYVRDENAAKFKMWELAKTLAYVQFCSGYRTNFLKINEKELHLIGSYRFFFIAYDSVLHRINYSRVQEFL